MQAIYTYIPETNYVLRKYSVAAILLLLFMVLLSLISVSNILYFYISTRKRVIPVVCVKIGNGMQSNTTISLKVYLMAILDNYMFRSMLGIFRLSSRELKVLLYTLSAHVVQRSLDTGLIS